MKYELIGDSASDRLLLIFAGWGMDARPFGDVSCDGCDVAVVYDYGDGTGCGADLSGYAEIIVIAWSFGVIAADRFVRENGHLPFTKRVAVNGTRHPVDDERGIPREMFEATLAGLSEVSVGRFMRRMCGGARAYREWEPCRPERGLESLRAELESVAAMGPGTERWDVAYVSRRDAVVPPANQIRAWGEAGVPVREVDWPHLPDFNSVIESEVVNKNLVAKRFASAAGSYEANAPVQRRMAERLSELWRGVSGDSHIVQRVIEIGAGTGVFTRLYGEWMTADDLELRDLSAISADLPGRHRICDGENSVRHDVSGSADALVSSATVQWFQSIPTFVEQCARVLKPGGWLVISTFGPDNFRELGGNGYMPMSGWLDLLADDYSVVKAEEWREEMHFGSPLELLRHIKLTGVNALASGGKSVTEARRLVSDGISTLTYHPLLLVARRSGFVQEYEPHGGD